MLGTELSSADTLRVVWDEVVRDMMTGVKNANHENYGHDTIRRLGKGLGADYVVSGNYWIGKPASDAPPRIDIALQDTQTGNPVARFTEQASMADLSDLVRKSSVILRRKLGATVASAATIAQISNAQPPSLDVAQRMAAARVAMQYYDAAKARDELLQVIAESPGFAPAYAGLSDA